jgi:DNA-binding Xre family transcriptional regulator
MDEAKGLHVKPFPNPQVTPSESGDTMSRMQLKSRVPQLMAQRNISNAYQLRQLTGLGYATCHRLANGSPPTRAATIQRLAECLKVRPGDLFQ